MNKMERFKRIVPFCEDVQENNCILKILGKNGKIEKMVESCSVIIIIIILVY
jgi:hypothetical protein